MRNKSIKKIFILCLITFSFSLFIFYIFQINKFTNESSLIFSYQQKIAQLSQENKNLEIGIFQNNSIKQIEILANDLSYEKTDKIHYIKILGSTAIAR